MNELGLTRIPPEPFSSNNTIRIERASQKCPKLVLAKWKHYFWAPRLFRILDKDYKDFLEELLIAVKGKKEKTFKKNLRRGFLKNFFFLSPLFYQFCLLKGVKFKIETSSFYPKSYFYEQSSLLNA